MIYLRLEYYLRIILFINPLIIYTLLVSSLTTLNFKHNFNSYIP